MSKVYMNAFKKSMDTEGAVDSRGAGCLRRAFGLSNTEYWTRWMFILLVLVVGAAAAPTHALAAGCAGTGACYWVTGGANTNWSDTAKWATSSDGHVIG